MFRFLIVIGIAGLLASASEQAQRPPSSGDMGIVLTNGMPATNISGAQGSKRYYRITVPSNQGELEIKMFGGTGDADLYIKHGNQVPTLTEWDYRPYLIDNNETVTIADPASGSWLIMVHAYHAYAGLTVVATYKDDAPIKTLSNGVPVSGLSGATGHQAFYQIDVPADQSVLTIEMSGGTGDADLYVKRGSKPSTTSWDCRPYLIGNNESIHVDNPVAATWYIMIHACQAYAGVTLVAAYESAVEPVIKLTKGVPVTGLSGATGHQAFYQIDVPAGQDFLDIEMAGGTGDADLYVKRGSKPSTTSWDYRPYLIGNNESVHVDNPVAATWYIMIRASQAYIGVSLTATYGVGNNFATDPNCVALCRFEQTPSDRLDPSDTIGTNTLTNIRGSALPYADKLTTAVK